MTCYDQLTRRRPTDDVVMTEMKNCGDCHGRRRRPSLQDQYASEILQTPSLPCPTSLRPRLYRPPAAIAGSTTSTVRLPLYRINTDPTTLEKTLIRSDAKKVPANASLDLSLDKKGRTYVDIVWSCSRACLRATTRSQGRRSEYHSPATSTLDRRYGDQQAIYDEDQKWQEPVKAGC